MKIGSYHIGRSGIYREQALDIDTMPMFRQPSKVQYKTEGLNDLYEIYENHDLIRGMIDDLSESAAGQGIYTTVKELSPVFEKNRGKKLCDDFGAIQNLDEKLPKIVKNCLIAGFCPVETKLVPGVDREPLEKCLTKVVHPRTIIEIQTDPFTGEVLQAKQKVSNKEQTLTGKNLAWFTYGNLANDPRGLSFIKSVATLLTTLDNTTNLVTAISERYISPIMIAKSRLKSSDLKKAFQDRETGDAIFLGGLTPDEMKEETIRIYQVDPRVAFWEMMEDLQIRLYNYGRASNLYMTRNANLASAEKLEDIVARHVASIQRNIKRTIEREWYTPLIDMNGLDMDDIPRVNFGREPTGVEDIAPADIITKGLELGYISQPQYYEILRTLGVKVTEELQPTEKEVKTQDEKPEEEGSDEEKKEVKGLDNE